MTHDLVNYQHEKNQTLVNQLCQQLGLLGRDARTAGDIVRLSVSTLSEKIDAFSESTEKQSNRMYWLTWMLAIAGILNVAAIVFQTYHH